MAPGGGQWGAKQRGEECLVEKPLSKLRLSCALGRMFLPRALKLIGFPSNETPPTGSN